MTSIRRRSHRGHNSYGTSSASFYAREERIIAAARAAFAAQSTAITNAVRPPTSEELNQHAMLGQPATTATPNRA